MNAMLYMTVLYEFNNKYQLEPAKANLYLSYINLTWTPKIIYGIFMDCVPIFGSTKRSYIFIFGVLQGLACLVIWLVDFKDAVYLMLLTAVCYLGAAFMDVVADGMMVVSARKDP